MCEPESDLGPVQMLYLSYANTIKCNFAAGSFTGHRSQLHDVTVTIVYKQANKEGPQ